LKEHDRLHPADRSAHLPRGTRTTTASWMQGIWTTTTTDSPTVRTRTTTTTASRTSRKRRRAQAEEARQEASL